MLYIDPRTLDAYVANTPPPLTDRVPSKRAAQRAWDELLLALPASIKADLADSLDVLRRRLFLD